MKQPEQLRDSDGYQALVFLKSPGKEKSRLRGVLSPAHRSRLVERMFHHVLCTLDAAPCIDVITVVTPDPVGRRLILPARCDVLTDHALGASGINALASAWQSRFALGTPLLIVHPDLPLLGVDDLQAVANAHTAADVMLGSDRANQGTNLLAFRAGDVTRFAFGMDSRRQHLKLFGLRRLSVIEINRTGIASDIDLPHDLRLLPPRLAVTADQGFQ